MKLDLVHDIQGSYRKVLNAMARPGVIESLKVESEKVDININCFKSTFLIMLMLLDGEVSFNVISKDSMDITGIVSQITYAKIKPIEEADYLFVINDISSEVLEDVYRRAKIGDLVDPNKSATIVCEFDKLKYGDELILSGPGIKNVNKISLSGSKEWIAAREEVNDEYPLGVDAIYIDKEGSVLCLPRTTEVKYMEV